MTKASGLGSNLYVAGYDLSGDVGMLSSIRESQALLDVTAIDKSAMERVPGLGDGEISFTAFLNDAALQEHVALKSLAGDKIATFAQGTTLGSAGAGLTAKQVNYDGTRGADGSIAFNIQMLSSNGDSLRWGQMLTAGKRTDTGATNGSSVNEGGATSFGAVFYLHVFAFTGTDVTVKIQDSANDSAWSDLASAAFTQTTSAPTSQMIALTTGATVRQYLRAVTTTVGGVTSVTFAVLACRRYAAI